VSKSAIYGLGDAVGKDKEEEERGGDGHRIDRVDGT
jgi:hypothetical protein